MNKITHVLIYRYKSKVFEVLPVKNAMQKVHNSFISRKYDIIILSFGKKDECEKHREVFVEYIKDIDESQSGNTRRDKIKEHAKKVMEIINNHRV